MNIKSLRFALSVLVLLVPFIEARATDQRCLESACFSVDSTILPKAKLIGAGHFTYWGFSVYSAGLYSATYPTEPANILAQPRLKLVISYHRNFSAKDFIRSGREILEDNPKVKTEEYNLCLSEVDKLYQDVKVGDSYAIVKDNERGLSLYLNNTYLGSVCDADFATVYLSIWLSKDYGISSSFQRELTGIHHNLTEL